MGYAADQIEQLPGYRVPDVRRLERGATLMKKLGYGPDKTLNIKVTTRDWSIYRDPAVLLIDQLKQIYIEGELEMIDTPRYFSEDPSQGLHGRAQFADQAGKPIRSSTRSTAAVRA